MRPSSRATAQGFLTIQSVIQKSGAHRQTIHYYRRKGLLPPAVITSRTSALYLPETVELIKLIRQFQERRRLSLDEIAAIYQRLSYDVAAIREELHSLPAASGAGAYTVDQVIASLEPEPPRNWIEELVTSQILLTERANGQPVFSMESLEVARSLWKWHRMGFSIDHFREWQKQSWSRADEEFRRFLNGLRARPYEGSRHPETVQLFEVFRLFTAYHRGQALRSQMLGEIERALFRFVDSNFRQIFPSETFLARMGLNREIDRLRIRLARHPGDLNALRNLARAYQLRSDWPRLHEVAMEILRTDPRDALAAADLGRSLMYLGRFEESRAVLETALRRAPHPLVKLRLGQLLIIQAKRSGDPGRFLEALGKKAELCSQAMEESRNQPSLYRKIRLNLVLEKMSTDDPLGLQGSPLEELRQLYKEFHSVRDQGLSTLARISLIMGRMFIAFALYLVLKEQGSSGAEKFRREILRTDPDGILSARGAAGSATKVNQKKGRPSISV